MSEAVELRPYDPSWATAFAEEREVLLCCFDVPPHRLEHIGSTAIPGLAAKPVIDILALVESRARAEAALPALESVGYVAVPNYPDPHRLVLIKRRADGERSHHLHVHSDAGEAERHLVFRDCLRADPARRDAYAALKQDLAQRFRNDRNAYSRHKTAFIDAIVLGQGGPARRTPWNP